VPYLSASAVVIHYEEALSQVYAHLPFCSGRNPHCWLRWVRFCSASIPEVRILFGSVRSESYVFFSARRTFSFGSVLSNVRVLSRFVWFEFGSLSTSIISRPLHRYQPRRPKTELKSVFNSPIRDGKRTDYRALYAIFLMQDSHVAVFVVQAV